MTKKILKVDYNHDISIIGINSASRDYRLCWAINKSLSLTFMRVDDLLIYNDFGIGSHHSCYKHELENSEIILYLISNKSENTYLVPEMKESDFFILSTDLLLDEDQLELIHQLNKIDIVQTAYTIDPYSLKSKENLLFF